MPPASAELARRRLLKLAGLTVLGTAISGCITVNNYGSLPTPTAPPKPTELPKPTEAPKPTATLVPSSPTPAPPTATPRLPAVLPEALKPKEDSITKIWEQQIVYPEPTKDKKFLKAVFVEQDTIFIHTPQGIKALDVEKGLQKPWPGTQGTIRHVDSEFVYVLKDIRVLVFDLKGKLVRPPIGRDREISSIYSGDNFFTVFLDDNDKSKQRLLVYNKADPERLPQEFTGFTINQNGDYLVYNGPNEAVLVKAMTGEPLKFPEKQNTRRIPWPLPQKLATPFGFVLQDNKTGQKWYGFYDLEKQTKIAITEGLDPKGDFVLIGQTNDVCIFTYNKAGKKGNVIFGVDSKTLSRILWQENTFSPYDKVLTVGEFLIGVDEKGAHSFVHSPKDGKPLFYGKAIPLGFDYAFIRGNKLIGSFSKFEGNQKILTLHASDLSRDLEKSWSGTWVYTPPTGRNYGQFSLLDNKIIVITNRGFEVVDSQTGKVTLVFDTPNPIVGWEIKNGMFICETRQENTSRGKVEVLKIA